MEVFNSKKKVERKNLKNKITSNGFRVSIGFWRVSSGFARPRLNSWWDGRESRKEKEAKKIGRGFDENGRMGSRSYDLDWAERLPCILSAVLWLFRRHLCYTEILRDRCTMYMYRSSIFTVWNCVPRYMYNCVTTKCVTSASDEPLYLLIDFVES